MPIAAGEFVIASDILGGRQFARLTVDHPGVSSSTAMVNTGLSFAAVAGGVYTINSQVFYVGNDAGDIQFGMTFPAGRLDFGGRGPHNAGVTGAASSGPTEWIARQNQTVSPSAVIPFGASTTVLHAVLSGTFVCTASGTVNLRYAQNVANATTTIVKSGSWLVAVREA